MILKRLIPLVLTLLLFAGTASASGTRNINAAQALELLQNNPDVFILDVRTSQEYLEIRLEGARLIPIDQFVRRMGEVPKDGPVLVYCAVGSRSSQVAGYLARQGYDAVYNMYGGVYAWKLRGYPVVQGMP